MCTEGFSSAGGGGSGEDDDRPVEMKCSHVVGRKCIEQWILSRHNSLPDLPGGYLRPGAVEMRDGWRKREREGGSWFWRRASS